MEDTQGREYHYQADWTVGSRMFHIRFDDFGEFMLAIKNMEKLLPSTKSFPDDEGSIAKTADPSIEECPKCHVGTLVAGASKDGTKHFKKCSTNKWNAIEKKATGCDYIKWV